MIRISISGTVLHALISKNDLSQNLVNGDIASGVNAHTVDGPHVYVIWRLLVSDLRELTNHLI